MNDSCEDAGHMTSSLPDSNTRNRPQGEKRTQVEWHDGRGKLKFVMKLNRGKSKKRIEDMTPREDG